jgi:uncharacterized membrane protein
MNNTILTIAGVLICIVLVVWLVLHLHAGYVPLPQGKGWCRNC